MKEENYFLTEEQLDEKTHISLHYRDVTTMARLHLNKLKDNNYKIIDHKTNGDGSHTISYITPNKKVRVSTIVCVYDRPRVKTKIIDKPSNDDLALKYNV